MSTQEKKHTPGPWDSVAAMSSDFHAIRYISGSHCEKVATVTALASQAESLANASLIKAAPDMLTALRIAENFMTGFEDDESQEGMDGMLATIRAAINKAEGGKS